MSIQLSRLCANTEKSYDMKLIAGKAGMDSPVRWVHMIEDMEAAHFIHGNELVFTTGIRQQGTDWILGFVLSLRESGAVGLVLNIGPYITTVPPHVIVYCEQNGFPLFTLPWKIHIIDVTYDFCHRIIRNEETETGIAAAFRNLIFSPENDNGYRNTMLRSGFHDESSYTVMAISVVSQSVSGSDIWEKYKFSFTRVLRKSPYPVCIFLQEHDLIVVRQKSPPEETEAIANELSALIADNDNGYFGISSSATGWAEIPRLYNEAVSAIKAAKQQNKSCMHYSDIGVYKLLFGVRDSSILADFVKTELGTLLSYDASSNTDCTDTLRCYLENDSSVQSVAAIMNVHRNTVNYKMKTIKDVLRTELHDTDKMNLMLAFRAMDMLNAV